MSRRFSFGAPSLGDRILSAADDVKIHVMRIEDDGGEKKLLAHFYIGGVFNDDNASDAKELLAMFLANATEGGAANELAN